MRYWVAVVSEERFAGERLYAFDSLVLPSAGIPAAAGVTVGDPVALVVAAATPALFGLGRIRDHRVSAGQIRADQPVSDQPVSDQPRAELSRPAPSPDYQPRGDDDDLHIAYTHRLFDGPVPVGDILTSDDSLGERATGDERQVLVDLSTRAAQVDPNAQGALLEVSAAVYTGLAGRVGPDRRTDADRTGWFVSVALPIEASSRAEAVREFWTYVTKLGPQELPAFVWPQGNELAMQAFVLGQEANLDPEEE